MASKWRMLGWKIYSALNDEDEVRCLHVGHYLFFGRNDSGHGWSTRLSLNQFSFAESGELNCSPIIFRSKAKYNLSFCLFPGLFAFFEQVSFLVGADDGVSEEVDMQQQQTNSADHKRPVALKEEEEEPRWSWTPRPRMRAPDPPLWPRWFGIWRKNK